MKKTWAKYYESYQPNKLNIFLHFHYLISILILCPKSIIEIGCGSADHSIFIKKAFNRKKISFLDNDKIILNNAQKKYSALVSNFYEADILNKKMIQSVDHHDIAMSQGLMEHFNDDDFIKIIKNFRGKVKYFIFSIPSNYYPTIDFGNEILRSNHEIKNLLSNIERIDFSVKNYFDIGIKTKMIGAKKINNPFLKFAYFFKSNHLLIKIRYL